MRGHKLIALLLLLHLMPVYATHDVQIWSNITANGPLSKSHDKFRYWLESQGRFGDEVSRLSQFLVRPGLGYSITPNASLWLGYAWIYTTQPFATPAFEENRIWQQWLWIKHYDKVKYILRTRLEERFMPQNIRTAWRFRQLVKVDKPLAIHPKVSFVATEEVFIHLNNFTVLNNQGFDQNRFFVGLGYKIAPHTSLEGGYLNQAIRRINTSNFHGNYLSVSLLFNG